MLRVMEREERSEALYMNEGLIPVAQVKVDVELSLQLEPFFELEGLGTLCGIFHLLLQVFELPAPLDVGHPSAALAAGDEARCVLLIEQASSAHFAQNVLLLGLRKALEFQNLWPAEEDG